ncbi:MAG TPA: hypothetical protein VNV38_09080 [Stellaceae bacterium]|jgi:hypothetical protein|nr:hypothetical protein [Stellaceae bacterium]
MYPIKFDEELNEYSFEDKVLNGSLMIYHCPFCGGVASESRRDSLFAKVSGKEAVRLRALVANLHTKEAIEAALGEPDKAQIHHRPPEEIALFRKLASSPVEQWTFTGLSRTANVDFSIYPDGKIECGILPKPKRRRRAPEQ